MLCTKTNQLIEIVIYIMKNNVRCNNANNISLIMYYCSFKKTIVDASQICLRHQVRCSVSKP